jgi:hypothetical protein
MLVKSDRNKVRIIFLLGLLFLEVACNSNRRVFNTEISCTKVRVMVRFAEAEEVRGGIERAFEDKKKYGTNENYTVIRMPGNRSFKVERLAPEEAMKCVLTQFEVNTKYKEVEKYYH